MSVSDTKRARFAFLRERRQTATCNSCGQTKTGLLAGSPGEDYWPLGHLEACHPDLYSDYRATRWKEFFTFTPSNER